MANQVENVKIDYGSWYFRTRLTQCLPLVPNRLVYPEIYPKDPCIYNTDNQLFKKLKSFCRRPDLVRQLWTEEVARATCEKYSTESLTAKYLSLLQS